MAIRPFLAMTETEIRRYPDISFPIAWLGCHVSSRGSGLSPLPGVLPEGAMLIVDDRIPIRGHDPAFIAGQLDDLIHRFHCPAVVLDFQRHGSEEAAALADCLVQALPCPVAVSEYYAGNQICPVFLSPVPPSCALVEHLSPWKGREIFLDISPAGEVITLTEKGAQVTSLPAPDLDTPGFADEILHCHYHIQSKKDQAIFTLWRTREDLEALMEEAEALGVANIVGLFQEVCSAGWSPDPALQL